jgi:hypothetical protein
LFEKVVCTAGWSGHFAAYPALASLWVRARQEYRRPCQGDCRDLAGVGKCRQPTLFGQAGTLGIACSGGFAGQKRPGRLADGASGTKQNSCEFTQSGLPLAWF